MLASAKPSGRPLTTAGSSPFNYFSAGATLAVLTLSAAALLIAYSTDGVARNELTLASFTVGSVHVALAVALIVFTAALAGRARSLPETLPAPLGLMSAALSLWLVTEGLTAFHGKLVLDDALELAFDALMATALVWSVRSALRQRTLELERQRRAGEHDPLTGLLNRTGVQRRYGELRTGEPATVLVFDLNDLKTVNDSGGHGAGDAHIRAVADAIRSNLPEDAILGRWGGDEFVAVVPNASEAQALGLAEAAERAAPHPRGTVPAFCVGAAPPRGGEPLERAFATADQRMYERKAELHAACALSTGERGVHSVEDVSKRLELLETPEEVLDVGLALARDALGFGSAAHFAVHGERMLLGRLEGFRAPDGGALQALDLNLHQPSLVSSCVQSNGTVWTADYAADPRAAAAWVEFGLKSSVATPVRRAGQIVGVLAFMHFTTWKAITPQVRSLLAAIALRLGHTHERLRAIEEVRATLEGGLLGLGVALEARDLETGGHTERVVALSAELGRALGLDDRALGELKQGAYLHDLGKLTIPDAVLLKPGRLDPDEWAVMQTHAARGHEIASRIPTLGPAALAVVRHHHERWDGTGYPDGLAGEGIPLLARVFTVADVYDALLSERPYKRAWSRERAVAELLEQRGRQLDPVAVDAFVNLVLEPALPAPRAIVGS